MTSFIENGNIGVYRHIGKKMECKCSSACISILYRVKRFADLLEGL